jgi:formylglycine-generating enzyme required for sulfatase activity
MSRVFADESYLKQWNSDLKLHSSSDLNRPVVQVSWFAATAFCHSLGRELPTTDQWEYAAEDAGRNSDQVKSQILKWYGAPNPKSLERVKIGTANGYGIHDLHDLIWEWTLDFNSAMIGSELRSDGTKDENLFCGAGSLNAQDASDYAKFMRYSLRSSLRADYTTANLGFRCAREEKNEARSGPK